jgi:Rrf2 family protein
MQISARCKYALLAVLEMAKSPPETVLKAGEIAAKPGIPPDYLVQVLIQLKTGRIVESVRGKMGGYRLSRPPGRISVADVIEAVEPSGRSEAGLGRALQGVLKKADQAARDILADTTFEELCTAEREGLAKASYVI